MLYLLTLEDEYEGTCRTFGVFDRAHIIQAIRDAYRACATYDVIDKSWYLEDGSLGVTPIESNWVYSDSPKMIRVVV